MRRLLRNCLPGLLRNCLPSSNEVTISMRVKGQALEPCDLCDGSGWVEHEMVYDTGEDSTGHLEIIGDIEGRIRLSGENDDLIYLCPDCEGFGAVEPEKDSVEVYFKDKYIGSL